MKPMPTATLARPATDEGREESAGLSGRDPAVDLLRVVALAAVVLGHWLITVVHWDGDRLHAANLLDVAPATQWATWLFQVLPLFFAVGGWASARSLTRTSHPGTDWVAHRIRGLLIPAGTYALVATGVVLGTRTVWGDVAAPVSSLLGMHLWFLAVFVPVTAITPWLYAAVRAHGWWIPVAFAAAVAAVDLGRFVGGVDALGWANFAFLWAGFTAWGIAAHERPPRPTHTRLVAFGAFVVLVAVIALGWYPHSMVGVDARSNNTPPTIALGLLGLTQVALATAVAPRLAGLVARRRGLGRAVEVGGALGFHAYLWHLCATVIAVMVLSSQVGNLEPLTGLWWLTRPAWVAGLALLAAPIILAAAHIDRWRLARPKAVGGSSGPGTTLATIVAVPACTVLALGGLDTTPEALVALFGLVIAPALTSQTVAGRGRIGESLVFSATR